VQGTGLARFALDHHLSEIQTSKPRVLDQGLGKQVLALIPDEVLLV
jgi:hypothetical protein